MPLQGGLSVIQNTFIEMVQFKVRAFVKARQ